MKALNFIKNNHKLYIGNKNNIDYSLLDNNNNTYFYYEYSLKYLTNNFNDINDDEFIFNNYFKNNFLIISINNNNVKLQQCIKDNKCCNIEHFKIFDCYIKDNKLYLNIINPYLYNYYKYMFNYILIKSNNIINDIIINFAINVYIIIDYMPNLKNIIFNGNYYLFMNKYNINVNKIKRINNTINLLLKKSLNYNKLINKFNNINYNNIHKINDTNLKDFVILNINNISLQIFYSKQYIYWFYQFILKCIDLYNDYIKYIDNNFKNLIENILWNNRKNFDIHNKNYSINNFNKMFLKNKLCNKFINNINNDKFLNIISKYFNNSNLNFDNFKNDILNYFNIDNVNDNEYNNFIKYLKLFYKIKNKTINIFNNYVNSEIINFNYYIQNNELNIIFENKMNNNSLFYKNNINLLIKTNDKIKKIFLIYDLSLHYNIYIDKIYNTINYNNNIWKNNIKIIL